MRRRFILRPFLAAVDILLMGGAFLLAYWLRFEIPFFPPRPVPSFDPYLRFSFLVAFVGFAMLYSCGLYSLRYLSFRGDDFFGLLRAMTLSTLTAMIVSFVLRGYITPYGEETYSRIIILTSGVLSLVLLTLWRSGVSAVFKYLRRRGFGLKRVIIVGTDQVGRGFHRAVQRNVDFEYRPVGFVYNGEPVGDLEVEGLRVLGGLEDLPAIIQTERVDEVVLACMDLAPEVVAQLVKTCERTDVQFSMIPGFFEILTRQMRVSEVADIPIFQLEERIFQRWGRLVKRGMDIALSILVVALLSPFLALVALLIKLESRGSIFYKHARVGKGEKLFYMYKFRSMVTNAEERRAELETLSQSGDALLKLPKDPRVTPFGRFLRKWSIDEIPQVLNVLKGEMSWVGPRPHIPSEVAGYKEWHRRKYDVLPGVTGLTQVSGRKDLTLDEMVRLDIYYIENWSPLLDVQLLLRTVPEVLLRRGAY